MVTLIRTLKRITTSTSPPTPPLTNESSKSKTATAATGTDQNILVSQIHYDCRQKEIETTANDAIEMSKKERAPSDNTTSAQNTPNEKSAAVNPNEKKPQSDQKRKASTHEDEELLPTKKAAVNKYIKICSANGCTNVVVQGGVCTMHGAKFKRCSGEGCTACAQNGGVCIRHGTNLPQACLAAADNPTQSNTEVLEAPNASEVLDLFPDSVAPTHPTLTLSSTMAYDPSPLGGIFIGQRNFDRLDQQQQEHQSMQQQQQRSIPQHDYQLKEDMPLPHFGSSQLHCGISTNNVVGRNIFGENIIRAHRYPTRLSIPTDEQFLDPVHNFLRFTCIEVFVSGGEYTSRGRGRGRGRGSKSNVGLRCVHCKHVPKRERAKQAVSYPSKTAHIYESVRNFQRIHLEACDYIPNEIKQKYRKLMSQKYRKIPVKYVKVYVAEAACEIGMVQTPNGLFFGAPPNTSGKPSEKLQAIMSIAENPTAFKHLEDVIFPKVDDRLKKSKFSHIASEKTLKVIANCRKGEAAFVYPSDFPTLSDFCFVLYHQFVPCRPPSTALIRRKTKPEKWDTLSGLCCKYCREAHPKERHHKSMYFPLDLQALHDSSFSHNLTDHVMTCQLVPLEIKEALEELQRLTAEHGVTTKRGAKQNFMKKLWERMTNYYPAPPIVHAPPMLQRRDEAAATETEAVAVNKKSSPASSDDKTSPRKASTADILMTHVMEQPHQ
eukprot:scaffold4655_cov118-Skeletonema_dohrnii-CCMP3373.AAC.4